jgi:3-oxoadipate enol-lactonase
MPFLDARGVRLFHLEDGPADGPPLLLANSLGTTLEMWDPEIEALARRFRVIRYDSRGHGRSDVPEGPYTIELLGRDALALIDGLGLDRVAFCGLSMGGMVGQWLGSHAADRLTRLALCNTAAHAGSPGIWDQRIATVEAEGMAAIVPGIIERWFTRPFQDRDPAAVERIRAMLLGTSPRGYAACCAAIRDMDQRPGLPAIPVPTLVVAGTLDQGTPPAQARAMAAAIPDARYVELPAAHLSNIETAPAFTATLLDFLAG